MHPVEFDCIGIVLMQLDIPFGVLRNALACSLPQDCSLRERCREVEGFRPGKE